MADIEANLGAGSTGVPPGGQLEADLLSLSDPAKRAAQVEATRRAAVEANAKKNLEIAQGKSAEKMRALNNQVADHIMEGFDLDDVTQRNEYMRELSSRIVEIRKKAKEAKDTTGNLEAANTYNQVSEILTKRLHDLQSEDISAAMAPVPGGAVQPVQDNVGPGPAPATPRLPKAAGAMSMRRF